ncbi:MAG: IgGFc-binding protein [Sandaracinaceae bacterium]|nr:IgGFc-binding protein [Sandaracinaceae bacterium]
MNLGALSGLAGVWLVAAIGCDAGPRPPGTRDAGPVGADAATSFTCVPGAGGFRCEGNEAIECRPDGTDGTRTNCVTSGQVCADRIGCTTCVPNRFRCNGNTVELCNGDGTAWTTHAACDASLGQMCNAVIGGCTSPCDDAAATNSYIGCEYFPVTTLNSELAPEFVPAVVVSNPQTEPAMVTVTGPAGFSQSRTLAAGAVETIELPWVAALKGTPGAEASALVSGGAYHLRSTLPVTVYQFNPLEYRIPRDCAHETRLDPGFGDSQCFSHSNDASLLLPAHVMTGNYIAVSRPTMYTRITQPGLFGPMTSEVGHPGFVTIVGVSATPVTVNVQYRGRVVAGTGVTAAGPGQTGSFTLNQGDVLQLVGGRPTSCTPGFTDRVEGTTIDYCTVSEEFDLTGTEIRATGRVQVIAGHSCAFVPYNRWACDHLEEAMFPLETWGTETIVSASQPLRSEPNLIRIVSGVDGNSLTFDPAPPGVSATTLSRGQILEFEARDSFRVSGTGALVVAQHLVGQDYAGISTAGAMGEGDPSMSLGIPTEQFRTQYSFLAPVSFARSYVNVTAPTGATITLDGVPVSGFTPVGGTGYGVARVMISGGQHNITGDRPFGIVVYGFGSYTSYMYPGGLDFEEINPLI